MTLIKTVTPKLFLLIAFLFIGNSMLFSQSKAKQIKDIRKKFNIINQDTTYKEVLLENEELDNYPACNGSQVIGYFNEGELKRVNVFYGKSYGVSKFEYYYWKNELFFVYEEDYSFYFDIELSELRYDSVSTKYEARYYFANNKLIETKIKGERLMEVADDSNLEEKSKNLLANAKDFAAILNKKNGKL